MVAEISNFGLDQWGTGLRKISDWIRSPVPLSEKNPREIQLDGIGKPKVLCHSTCDVIKMNSCSNMLVLSIGLYISIQSLTILTPYSQIKDNKNNILKSWSFFKSSNKIKHPTVFLILCVTRIVNKGSNTIKWWDFAFFDRLWIKLMRTRYQLCIMIGYN